MHHHLIATVVLSLVVVQSTAHAQEARPDGLKALGHYVGSWHTTNTNKVDGSKGTVKESTAWILKDRFILGRESSQPDGVKSLWLMTNDPESRTYPFWYFNNKGGLGGEWGGTWDETSKTLTFKATDTPPGPASTNFVCRLGLATGNQNPSRSFGVSWRCFRGLGVGGGVRA